jgi:hypothetical protein
MSERPRGFSPENDLDIDIDVEEPASEAVSEDIDVSDLADDSAKETVFDENLQPAKLDRHEMLQQFMEQQTAAEDDGIEIDTEDFAALDEERLQQAEAKKLREAEIAVFVAGYNQELETIQQQLKGPEAQKVAGSEYLMGHSEKMMADMLKSDLFVDGVGQLINDLAALKDKQGQVIGTEAAKQQIVHDAYTTRHGEIVRALTDGNAKEAFETMQQALAKTVEYYQSEHGQDRFAERRAA